MKTENSKLMGEALKVVMEVMGANVKLGECYTDSSKCYTLGNNLFKTPIEFHFGNDNTFFTILFFDTMDAKNWSMTLRTPSRGYFIHEGDFYTECEDNADMAVEVPKQQVLDEIRSACKQYKDFSAIEKALDAADSGVFAAMRKK